MGLELFISFHSLKLKGGRRTGGHASLCGLCTCYQDHKSILESFRLEIDLLDFFLVSPTHSWKVSFVRRDFLPVPVLEESAPGCSASVLVSDPPERSSSPVRSPADVIYFICLFPPFVPDAKERNQMITNRLHISINLSYF